MLIRECWSAHWCTDFKFSLLCANFHCWFRGLILKCWKSYRLVILCKISSYYQYQYPYHYHTYHIYYICSASVHAVTWYTVHNTSPNRSISGFNKLITHKGELGQFSVHPGLVHEYIKIVYSTANYCNDIECTACTVYRSVGAKRPFPGAKVYSTASSASVSLTS